MTLVFFLGTIGTSQLGNLADTLEGTSNIKFRAGGTRLPGKGGDLSTIMMRLMAGRRMKGKQC